jgi:AraC family transcriptional regulator
MALSDGGAKYGNDISQVLSSSRARDWPGIYAELRAHGDVHLSSYVQQIMEVVVPIRGNCTVTRHIDGARQKTNGGAGTVFLFPAGAPVDLLHASHPSSAGSEVIHLYLNPELFSSQALGDATHEALAADLKSLGGFRDPLIEQIGRAIVAEMETETSSGRLLVETLTSTLAACLLHNYTGSSRHRSPAIHGPKGLDGRRLGRILEFIEANLEGDLTIESMAAIACLSRFHFARAFKASTGQAPHHYVSARRLERAKSLILDADRSLADIAYSLNFSSQSTFTKAFRRIVGQTPGQFRRSSFPKGCAHRALP